MRGVAALIVLARHSYVCFLLPAKPDHGYLAVDFFFMLSGFVIAHAYDRQLKKNMGFWDFLRVRLIRLCPLAWFGVLLGMTAHLCAARSAGGLDFGVIIRIVRATLANALLLPSSAMLASRAEAFPMDGPLWSLSVEIGVNILYVMAFRWITRASLALTCAVGIVLLGFTAFRFSGLDAGYNWVDLWAGWARVLFPFAAGMLLRRSLKPGRFSNAGHLAALPLLLLLVLPSSLVGGGAWYDLAVVILAFPVILAVGAQTSPSPLLDPLWRWLGTISYPLYVLHIPMITGVAKVMKNHHLQHIAPELAAFTGLGVIGLSWVAGVFFDAPFRRWLGRNVPRFAVSPSSGEIEPAVLKR